MTFERWLALISVTLAVAGFFRERRSRKSAEKDAWIAKEELKLIQRRGRAPFLRATHLNVPPKGVAGNQIIHLGDFVMPQFVEDGTMLYLSLANDGEEVRNVTDDWAGPEGISQNSQGINHSEQYAATMCYRYSRGKHGQPMRITIYFETLDGLKQHHVYETIHGACRFKRVDPAS